MKRAYCEYSIFVGGVPMNATKYEIEHCFSFIGSLQRVEAIDEDYSRSSISINNSAFYSENGKQLKNNCSAARDFQGSLTSGSCILVVSSKHDYEKIIRKSIFYIHQRKLICKPFVSGKKLFRLNHDINRRRVIVKKVPSDFSESQVQKVFESEFGTISHIFIFQDFKVQQESSRNFSKPGRSQKKYLTYSILFNEVISAKKASDRGFLRFSKGGISFMVEVLKYSNKKRKNPNNVRSSIRPSFLEATQEVEAAHPRILSYSSGQSFEQISKTDIRKGESSSSSKQATQAYTRETPSPSIKADPPISSTVSFGKYYIQTPFRPQRSTSEAPETRLPADSRPTPLRSASLGRCPPKHEGLSLSAGERSLCLRKNLFSCAANQLYFCRAPGCVLGFTVGAIDSPPTGEGASRELTLSPPDY